MRVGEEDHEVHVCGKSEREAATRSYRMTNLAQAAWSRWHNGRCQGVPRNTKTQQPTAQRKPTRSSPRPLPEHDSSRPRVGASEARLDSARLGRRLGRSLAPGRRRACQCRTPTFISPTREWMDPHSARLTCSPTVRPSPSRQTAPNGACRSTKGGRCGCTRKRPWPEACRRRVRSTSWAWTSARSARRCPRPGTALGWREPSTTHHLQRHISETRQHPQDG